MEDKENKAMELRALEAEANMRKAAEYGQQLISQISDLKKSKEHADQNIYELKNRLDACSVLEKAAAEDVEALKDANTKLMNDKEIAELQCAVKISKLLEEQKVKELSYESDILRLEDRLKLRSEQLAEIQDRFNRSLGRLDDESTVCTTGNQKVYK